MTSTMKSRIADTPIPPAMQELQKDHRGYPIPVIVLYDKEGRPHFTINDEYKRQLVIQQDLCPISGQKLHRARWFLGGPLSAFAEGGRYIDTPMLYECMEYALKVCPWLAAKHYDKRIEAKTLKEDSGVVTHDPTMIPNRPPLFVAVQTTRQDFFVARLAGVPMVQHVAPRKPYKAVEFWQSGIKLTHAQGLEVLEAEYKPMMDEVGLTLDAVRAQLPKER